MDRSLRKPGHRAFMKALIDIRKDKGLTQMELARLLEKSQSYVAKIEVGERRMDVVEFAEWSIAVDTDPMAVLTTVMTAVRQTKTGDDT